MDSPETLAWHGKGSPQETSVLISSSAIRQTAISPCIDTGDSAAPSLPYHDFEGDARIIDGNGVTGSVVDMGADEFVPGGDKGDYDEYGDRGGFDLATLAEGFGTLFHDVDLEIFARNFVREY